MDPNETPFDRDLITEDVVDMLVALVGRRAFDRIDPTDPRNGPFFDWLARDARRRQTPAERRKTDRQAVLFAERVQRRLASVRAGDRHRVQCVDEAPVSYPTPADRGDTSASTLGERTTPWWDLAVAAGSGRELWDEPPAVVVGLPDSVEEGRYIALGVAGDSMAPLLHAGDTILVRLCNELIADRVIVARHPEQGYVVRRVGRMSSVRVELVSLNAEYPALEIPNDASLVLGAVILRWCAHDRGRLTA
jgi:hypothetical protein